jgi:uncharacterized glyoxalase superfamily protein PhnB
MKRQEERFEMSPPTPFSVGGDARFLRSGSRERERDVEDAERERILAFCRERLRGGARSVTATPPGPSSGSARRSGSSSASSCLARTALIAHAQLEFGNGMIMLGSAGDGHFDAYQKTPADVGGVGTSSAYVIVADADAHHARARAAGAQILIELKDEDYGGRGYTCRDPEGRVPSSGPYDPSRVSARAGAVFARMRARTRRVAATETRSKSQPSS